MKTQPQTHQNKKRIHIIQVTDNLSGSKNQKPKTKSKVPTSNDTELD